MKSDEMLALVGGDLKLSRDLSGGSFGALFSDEASRAELQQAMLAHLNDEYGRTPPSQSRPKMMQESTPAVPAVPSTSEAAALSAQSHAQAAVAEGWLGLDRPRGRASLPYHTWAGGFGGALLRPAEPRVEGSGGNGAMSAPPLPCASGMCAPYPIDSTLRGTSTGAPYLGTSHDRVQPRSMSTVHTRVTSDRVRDDSGDVEMSHDAKAGDVNGQCAAASERTSTAGAAPLCAGVAASSLEPPVVPTHAMPRAIESNSRGLARTGLRAASLAPASAPMPASRDSSHRSATLPSSFPRVEGEPRLSSSLPMPMGLGMGLVSTFQGAGALSLLPPGLCGLALDAGIGSSLGARLARDIRRATVGHAIGGSKASIGVSGSSGDVCGRGDVDAIGLSNAGVGVASGSAKAQNCTNPCRNDMGDHMSKCGPSKDGLEGGVATGLGLPGGLTGRLAGGLASSFGSGVHGSLGALGGPVPGLHPSITQQPNGANATLVGLAHEAAVASAAASAASALSGGRSARPNSGAHVAAAAAASAASRLIHAEAEASGAARGSTRASSINRRAWSAEEDDTIRACVDQMGMRWRQIAPLLPGRSDDSVRNRWKRLKEEADAAALRSNPGSILSNESNGDGSSGDESGNGRLIRKRPLTDEAPAASKRHASKAVKDGTNAKAIADADGEAGQRISWSPHEDQVIVRAVQELGPRWCAVAARLPSRTDQAVRNRWNRLQQRARVQARTMLNAFQGRSAGAPTA